MIREYLRFFRLGLMRVLLIITGWVALGALLVFYPIAFFLMVAFGMFIAACILVGQGVDRYGK